MQIHKYRNPDAGIQMQRCRDARYTEPRSRDPEIQRSTDPEIHRSRDPEIHRSRDPQIQRSRDPQIQRSRYRDGRCRDAEMQIHRSRDPEARTRQRGRSVLPDQIEGV
jgi:hypothetical protein